MTTGSVKRGYQELLLERECTKAYNVIKILPSDALVFAQKLFGITSVHWIMGYYKRCTCKKEAFACIL